MEFTTDTIKQSQLIEAPTNFRVPFKDFDNTPYFICHEEIIGVQKADNLSLAGREPSIKCRRLTTVLLRHHPDKITEASDHFTGMSVDPSSTTMISICS